MTERVEIGMHGEGGKAVKRYRLSVFKSNRHIYAQIIDDVSRTTLVAASSLCMKLSGNADGARSVGEELGKRALSSGLQLMRFDRGDRRYGKTLAALADGARHAGLEF